MYSRSARAVMPAGLVVGLLCGCSHSSKPRQEAPAPERGSTVTSEDIERSPGQSIQQALKGRVAGVEVTETPSGISVRIRGATSFQASTEPLYVLDGIPIQPGPGGVLTGINPHDIESIQVLKNPDETALYGVRGANGVIVIKTKRPGRKPKSD
jgi:TonB-dependent SusC/RagA subfamily outer membrane receptor